MRQRVGGSAFIAAQSERVLHELSETAIEIKHYSQRKRCEHARRHVNEKSPNEVTRHSDVER
jgi:hypothetical protein